VGLPQEKPHAAAFIKAVTNLFGISHRRPKQQGITAYSHGLSIDCCKVSPHHAEKEFTAKSGCR
jgi:hypothetical protein